MRFKRGSQVEVLIKKKVPSGVWRSAEIVADNKDSYTVRYYRLPGGPSEAVEKVSAESVRPRPPPLKRPMIWSVGDIVEVLDSGYWKAAIIEEDMGEDGYYIHVIGSIDEFEVEKSLIRVRQEWKDNKWVLSGKDSICCEDMISRMLMKTRMQREGDVTVVQEVLEPALQSKILKRTSPDSSYPDEVFAVCVQKKRAVEKNVLERVHGDSYSFIGKVENSAYPREKQGKDNEQTFTQKTTTLINDNSRNHDVTEFLARTLEPDDRVSAMSSVASCSIINANPDRLVSHSSAGCSQDSESLCSDAESFQHLGVEEGMAESRSKEEYALRTHEIELYTYRCTLEALYASGPLSWEQEFLLTNLRIKLFVSNDEHLMELRRLKSTRNLGSSCH